MKKPKTLTSVKLLVVLLIFGSFLLSAKIIYDQCRKASVVNPLLVEYYQPRLETDLVKKAAEALKKKNG